MGKLIKKERRFLQTYRSFFVEILYFFIVDIFLFQNYTSEYTTQDIALMVFRITILCVKRFLLLFTEIETTRCLVWEECVNRTGIF